MSNFAQVRRLEEDKGLGLREEVGRTSSRRLNNYFKMSNGWKQRLVM